MAYQQRPCKGSLFKNGAKRHDKHPDMKGVYMHADGTMWQVSAWVLETNGGEARISFSTSPYFTEEQKQAWRDKNKDKP